MSDELRSYPATPRRRQQLREAGDIAVSPALTSAAVVTAAALLVVTSGPYAFGRLAALAERSFAALPGQGWDDLGTEAAQVFLWLTVPVAGVALLACLVAHGLQTGFLWAPRRLTPGLRFRGMGSILREAFGAHGLGVVIQMCLVAVGVGAVLHQGLRALLSRPEAWTASGVSEAALTVLGVGKMTLFGICCLLLAIGGLDALWQWWRRERGIRMSRREVLAELRELGVHPATRRRRIREARRLRHRQ